MSNTSRLQTSLCPDGAVPKRAMDLADATLVLLVEATGLREILTLDSDFQVYRIHQHETFEILP
ncbi:MAG: hypothetical protein ACO4AI_01560 [Prochlorothrix sp.]